MLPKQYLFLICLISFYSISAQEWKNLKSYQKKTGLNELSKGNWLKNDRLKNTDVWKSANMFNISENQANLKYVSIQQIRDFYAWFDEDRIKKGHEISWVGMANIAAGNLAKLDNIFVKLLVTNNSEIKDFARKGSIEVFEFAIPELKKIYFLKTPIKGERAKKWDYKYGKIEQCEILSDNYNRLSKKAIKKLQYMAEGRGVYRFAVPRTLRFKGSLKSCESRYNYSINALVDYYLKH